MSSSTQEQLQHDTPVIHRGACFCKAVKFEVQGLPTLSAYCHCTLCQRLTGGAFVATAHFPAERFSWAQDTSNDIMDSYPVSAKPWKVRWRCKNCGSQVASHNTKLDKWSVWGVCLERDEQGKVVGWDTIKPTAHIFYDTRLLDVNDDLSKWAGYEGSSERLG